MSDTTGFDVNEKVNILFKTAMGFPSTKESTNWFQETGVPYNTYVFGSDILTDDVPAEPTYGAAITPTDASIGLTAADFDTGGFVKDSTDGKIRYYHRLILDPCVSANNDSWHKVNSTSANVLMNALQFNVKKTSSNTPYGYVLTNKANVAADPGAPNEILQNAAGGNWFFDIKSGIVFFPDNSTPSLSVVDNSTKKPVFSFFTYIGNKGLGTWSGGGGGGGAGATPEQAITEDGPSWDAALDLIIDGKVGIGLTDPGSFKLNVNGSFNCTSLNVGGAAFTGSPFKGKVTASSMYISGDVTLPALVTGANNTTLGVSAGLSLVAGNANTFIGNDTGRVCTTGSTNTAIGQQAFYASNTTNCIAIGPQACYNISGNKNIAIGFHAHRYGNANNNVAIGSEALEAHSSYLGITNSIGIGEKAGRYQGQSGRNIWIGMKPGPQTASATAGTGSDNVAMGYLSMSNITSGYDNVAIGYETLLGATTRGHCIAIGKHALKSGTTGNSNIALGFQCLYNFSGNYSVGIGYDCLQQTLTGSYNVAIGRSAGFYATSNHNICIGDLAGWRGCGTSGEGTSGGGNVYIGHETGYSNNQTSNSTANWNVGMGYQALYYITSGLHNVAIGKQAGYTNTTGHTNVLIGFQAGKSIVIGTNNVCIGSNAGESDYATYGSANNVFIGFKAGQYSAYQNNVGIGYQALLQGSGAHNVAIGFNALKGPSNNTGRQNNVAIGYATLEASTSAESNVCIGHQAGQRISSGDKNICMGYQSLGYGGGGGNVTGTHNTVLGYQAGWGIQTGTSNIIIGGWGAQTITSGEDNICLGNSVGPSISTGDNNIAFGRYAMRYGIGSGSQNISIGPWTGPKSSESNQTGKIYIGNGYGSDNNTIADAGRGVDSFIYGDMTDGVEKLVFNANVGIATTKTFSPQCILNTGTIIANNTDGTTIPLGVHALNGTTSFFGGKGTSSESNYWGLYMGTLYNGKSYIQCGHKNNVTSYDLLLNPNGGNVGIGIVAVNDALEVKGGIRITDGTVDYCRIRMSDTFSVGEPGKISHAVPFTKENGSFIIEYTGGESGWDNELAAIFMNGDTMGIVNSGDDNSFHWYDEDGGAMNETGTGQHWYISTTGGITNSSDKSLKINIRYFTDEYDISNIKQKYSQIKFCKYQWKKPLKDPSGVKQDFYGIIAQDLEPLFPETIEDDTNGLKMFKQEPLQIISFSYTTGLNKTKQYSRNKNKPIRRRKYNFRKQSSFVGREKRFIRGRNKCD